MTEKYDVVVVGAGAAGLMCAIEAGKRGRSVLLLDHSKKIAEKIRISGGGRCNFTNLYAQPECYLSENAHFCKSALKQYTQNDFIALLEGAGIAYHEKKLGQLFCNESAQQIIDMLVDAVQKVGVRFEQSISVDSIGVENETYVLETTLGQILCQSLVIATGGLSIPKIGATKFGYEVARQFGMNVIETRPALVPLTFQAELLEFCRGLSGVSVDAKVSCGSVSFREGLLFTHRGLSGPSILQISSYWEEGQDITLNMLPDLDVMVWIKDRRQSHPKQDIQTAISDILPNRLAVALCERTQISGRLAELSDKRLCALAEVIQNWTIRPSGTEGYRTAEVTKGGVDTRELSSKTMEAKKQSGLYFIGEVVDVTGHLGGYNFQWAWSSGYVAGQYV